MIKSRTRDYAGASRCSAAARKIGRILGLRELHRAGIADGYGPGSRLLRVHLQFEAASVFAAVDGGLGAVFTALRGAVAGAVGAADVNADGAGSLAVRAGGVVFLSGCAIVRAAQA